MPIRIVKPSPSHAKPSAYRRVQASDLPEIMAPGSPRPHVPLTLLVKEWDYFPEDRAAMIEEEPEGPDPDDLCRIAAVVHALCARDGIPIPEWVPRHRSVVPIAWDRSCVMHGFIWERTVENAPPACEYHNVWFDYQFISPERRRITKDNWINNQAAGMIEADLPVDSFRTAYTGRCLLVRFARPETLLALKIMSGRGKDCARAPLS